MRNLIKITVLIESNVRYCLYLSFLIYRKQDLSDINNHCNAPFNNVMRLDLLVAGLFLGAILFNA